MKGHTLCHCQNAALSCRRYSRGLQRVTLRAVISCVVPTGNVRKRRRHQLRRLVASRRCYFITINNRETVWCCIREHCQPAAAGMEHGGARWTVTGEPTRGCGRGAGGSLSGEPLVAMEPRCDADNRTRQESRNENPRDLKEPTVTWLLDQQPGPTTKRCWHSGSTAAAEIFGWLDGC